MKTESAKADSVFCYSTRDGHGLSTSKSFIIFRGQETVRLNNVGDDSARLLVAIAQVAAEFYGVAGGVEVEYDADEYIVHEDEFCALVDLVYRHQRQELYVWLRHGAAIYEAIKGHRCEWNWEHPPMRPFVPLRLLGYAPE
jgi:hypothetical protein